MQLDFLGSVWTGSKILNPDKAKNPTSQSTKDAVEESADEDQDSSHNLVESLDESVEGKYERSQVDEDAAYKEHIEASVCETCYRER